MLDFCLPVERFDSSLVSRCLSPRGNAMSDHQESQIRLIAEPTIVIVAEMSLRDDSFADFGKWLRETEPTCFGTADGDEPFNFVDLLPHLASRRAEGRTEESTGPMFLTDNEMLVEIAGRGCYRSFGQKAGRKENDAYIANLFGMPGKIPHASVLYHAKMTFFFAGISRRMSHELIRHYVGADRSEEGAPSQESTRYTEHPGHFIVHPRDVEDPFEFKLYAQEMEFAYRRYREYLSRETVKYSQAHGHEPKGMDRKRIYEAAAMRLPASASTSFFWTTNPEALEKLFRERCDYAADLEMQRFATRLREVCHREWPNLFRGSNPEYQKTIHAAVDDLVQSPPGVMTSAAVSAE
jgi:thymidylate synthase (FAD)